MFNPSRISSPSRLLCKACLFTLAVVLFSACDSNPVEDDHEEHRLADVSRLALVMNGTEVVVIEEAQLADGFDNEIEVHAGEETALISLRATADDGDEIDLDDLSDEYFLEAEFGDDDIVGDDDIAAFEQHDEDGRWAFHVHGEAEGTTAMRLRLMHNDHADFETPGITVHVEPGDGDGDHDH